LVNFLILNHIIIPAPTVSKLNGSGSTIEPQPMTQPNAIAHIDSLLKLAVLLFSLIVLFCKKIRTSCHKLHTTEHRVGTIKHQPSRKIPQYATALLFNLLYLPSRKHI